MKKEIKIFCCTITIVVGFTIASQAQQKPSDRTLETEMKIVKQKQASRNTFINQMRTTTPVDGNNATTTVIQNVNRTSDKTNTTTSPDQKQIGLKPSQQPMRIPKKPEIIRQQ